MGAIKSPEGWTRNGERCLTKVFLLQNQCDVPTHCCKCQPHSYQVVSGWEVKYVTLRKNDRHPLSAPSVVIRLFYYDLVALWGHWIRPPPWLCLGISSKETRLSVFYAEKRQFLGQKIETFKLDLRLAKGVFT